jgi:hypothetical protein
LSFGTARHLFRGKQLFQIQKLPFYLRQCFISSSRRARPQSTIPIILNGGSVAAPTVDVDVDGVVDNYEETTISDPEATISAPASLYMEQQGAEFSSTLPYTVNDESIAESAVDVDVNGVVDSDEDRRMSVSSRDSMNGTLEGVGSWVG